MNYLAHAYLSFNNPEVLVGNIISDYVKGKNKFLYSEAIQIGINLHRAIDTFTDAHVIIKEAKQIFQPHYRLYSGAFIDVSFDHFLAKKLSNELDFKAYTENVYTQLDPFFSTFPMAFQKTFPGMRQHNWLYNYQFDWGMQKSFIGLQKRAKYIEEVETAFSLFQHNYVSLQNYFTDYWQDLYKFSQSQYELLYK
jgi:acyl carrier protein phosphodiesterase